MFARRSLLIGMCVVLAVAARSCATIGLDDDGGRMISALATYEGWSAPWYHSAYFLIASVLIAPFGNGHEFEALVWASALASAAAIAALVLAFPVGDNRGWVAAACVACSPGWWVNATRVELHGVQLLGGVVLLLGALSMQRAKVVTRREIALFALAVGAAMLCHRTNLFLLPGALWLAARGRSMRTWTEAVLACATMFLVATLINSREESLESALLQQRSVIVLSVFWTGFDPAFVWSELVGYWFPALMAPLVIPPRSWRAVLPALACAAPGIVFFSCFGVPTLGGYFGASLVFIVAAAATDGSTASRVGLGTARGSLAALALVLVSGLVVSRREVHHPERDVLATEFAQKLAVADITLPRGGVYFELDAGEQSLHGRRPGLFYADLYAILVAHHRPGIDFDEAAQRIVKEMEEERAFGRDVAFNLSWHEWTEMRELVEHYLGRVERFLRAQPDVHEVATPIGTHLVWPAPPRPGEVAGVVPPGFGDSRERREQHAAAD